MEINEGDYVMGMTVEGMIHGQVEHIMVEGGILGIPGTEYAIQSMPPENPAMSVRVFEEGEDGEWEPTAYSIGMMHKDATRLDALEGHHMSDDMENESMEYLYRLAKDSPCWDGYAQRGMKPGKGGAMVPNCVPVQKYHEALIRKAESYTPTSGMKAAASRALRWKKEGKATGAGTPVGWGRATDLVAGRSMSLSTVKRMYSFFSRHEVDKKGKDFNNTSNPSNGRIMWDAWGGDAGFSWSRGITERMKDKALFADFGKDYTMVEQLTEIFKADSVRVGQMVSWNSSGGTAKGKVKRIITSGSYNVPNSDFVIDATENNPVVVITLYADGKPTETTVAHRRSTLRVF